MKKGPAAPVSPSVTLVRPAGSLLKLQPLAAAAAPNFAVQVLSVISIHLNKTVATKAENIYQFLLTELFKDST